MTAPATPRAGLDSRVTTEDGQPTAERRMIRGWFRITRADGPSGVILAVRIPGCQPADYPYPVQAAALKAASRIYADYRDAVRQLAGDGNENED